MTLGVKLPRGQYDAPCRDLGGPTWSAIPERAEEATYAEIARLRQEVIAAICRIAAPRIFRYLQFWQDDEFTSCLPKIVAGLGRARMSVQGHSRPS
jgi:hypothetical protein